MPHDSLKKLFTVKVFYFRNGNVIISECLITVLKSETFKLNYLKLYSLALINLQYFITFLC